MEQYLSAGQISFRGHSFYLKGFAVMVGGVNYIRTCNRDLASLKDGAADSTVDIRYNRVIETVLKEDSHDFRAMEAYIGELVQQLADACPVSGNKILSLSRFS